MKYSAFFFLALCPVFLFAAPLKSIPYSFTTQLTAQSEKNIYFDCKQQMDFDCEFSEMSPIDQTPIELTLTFKRIQAEGKYNGDTIVVDTDSTQISSSEFHSLKRLINEPIVIELNADKTVKKPIERFEQLLRLSTMENNFISADLLDQLVEAILFPLKERDQHLKTTLYFPIKSEVNLNGSIFKSSIHINQPIEIQGLCSNSSENNSIQLNGQLHADGMWQPSGFFAQQLFLSHELKENKNLLLTESPLSFSHSLSLIIKDNNE